MFRSIIKKLSISNIKHSIQLQNFGIDSFYYPVKVYQNFFVLHNKFTYIIFKKSRANNVVHINITKVKNFKEIKNSIKHLQTILQISRAFIVKSFIDNITITGKLATEISLTKYIAVNSHFTIKYSPEKFPGLFVKIKTLGSIILFSSGSFIILGAKSKKKLLKLIDIVKISTKTCHVTNICQ